jgi:ATP-binding cassette, subfamily B, bacterial PglK
LINKIWKLLGDKQKKTFFSLVVFNLFILILEVASLSAIFPVIYSLSNDQSIFDKFQKLDFLESYIENSQYHVSLIFLFILTGIIIFKNFLLTIFNFLESKFIFVTQEKISVSLFANLISKNYNFHLNSNSADLITRIRADGLLIRDSIYALHVFVKSIIFLIGIFTFLIFVEPLGFFVTGSIFLLLGSIFYRITSKKISELGKIRQKMEINRTKKLQESFGGIKEIKSYIRQKLFLSNYENLADKIAKSYYVRDFTGKLPKVFLETLIVLIITLLTYISLINQKESIDIIVVLGVFSLTAIKALPHMSSLLSSINTFKFSKLPITYYENILNNEQTDKITKAKSDMVFSRSIELRDISYKYPDKESYVLENSSLKINKGEKILIKGKTGSGKSTLIDLILGFQSPISGKIIVDNKIISLNEKNWLKNISYVPQSIYMFDESIKYNITLSDNENIDEDLFRESLKSADLLDFINSLPKKENTFVGETGLNISGGQKQRIGIARALYKNSSIIILDESTNALDDQTENIIINSLKKKKDKTIIFISHKTYELNFDKQFYLQDGKILKQ